MSSTNWMCIVCEKYISHHGLDPRQCRCEQPQSKISARDSGIYRVGTILWGPNHSPKRKEEERLEMVPVNRPVGFTIVMPLLRLANNA
jgi:hypothetical protein